MNSANQYLLFLLLAIGINLTAQISPVPAGFTPGVLHFSEDFESGVPTGWTNVVLDQAKQSALNNGWVIDRDTTFTMGTGPASAQSGDFYAYCDGSSPILRGSTATMTSDVISLVGVDAPALLFYLNMHGQAGSFLVNVIDGGNTVAILPAISADVPGGIHASTEWEELYIDLTSYAGKSIQLEFVTIKPASGSNGDVSIDNIRIFGAAGVAVPTLGQWGLISLLLLLLIISISTIKELVTNRDMSTIN